MFAIGPIRAKELVVALNGSTAPLFCATTTDCCAASRAIAACSAECTVALLLYLPCQYSVPLGSSKSPRLNRCARIRRAAAASCVVDTRPAVDAASRLLEYTLSHSTSQVPFIDAAAV